MKKRYGMRIMYSCDVLNRSSVTEFWYYDRNSRDAMADVARARMDQERSFIVGIACFDPSLFQRLLGRILP